MQDKNKQLTEAFFRKAETSPDESVGFESWVFSPGLAQANQ